MIGTQGDGVPHMLLAHLLGRLKTHVSPKTTYSLCYVHASANNRAEISQDSDNVNLR